MRMKILIENWKSSHFSRLNVIISKLCKKIHSKSSFRWKKSLFSKKTKVVKNWNLFIFFTTAWGQNLEFSKKKFSLKNLYFRKWLFRQILKNWKFSFFLTSPNLETLQKIFFHSKIVISFKKSLLGKKIRTLKNWIFFDFHLWRPCQNSKYSEK